MVSHHGTQSSAAAGPTYLQSSLLYTLAIIATTLALAPLACPGLVAVRALIRCHQLCEQHGLLSHKDPGTLLLQLQP